MMSVAVFRYHTACVLSLLCMYVQYNAQLSIFAIFALFFPDCRGE